MRASTHFFLAPPTPPFLPVFAAFAEGLPLLGGSFRFMPGAAGLTEKNESRRPAVGLLKFQSEHMVTALRMDGLHAIRR